MKPFITRSIKYFIFVAGKRLNLKTLNPLSLCLTEFDFFSTGVCLVASEVVAVSKGLATGAADVVAGRGVNVAVLLEMVLRAKRLPAHVAGKRTLKYKPDQRKNNCAM